VARNLGAPAYGFTSATFDMIRQYRPLANVVDRPTGKEKGKPRGQGYMFIGHHEILFPLFHHTLTTALDLPEAGILDAPSSERGRT
jgi:hypothetical protein